jgi:uncharacterized surface protein with fasciclin (FAS1) repeats
MKLQTITRRGTAAAAVLALSVSLAACGSEDDGGSDSSAGDETTSESSPSEEAAPSEEAEEGSDAATGTFGEGCAAIPTTGDGSFDAMVQDPVATAASTNPVLTTLTAAVGSIDGLADTLNQAPALTVFAPIDDPAFAEIPKADLDALVMGGTEQGMESPLFTILANHVLGENADPTAVVGEKATLAEGTLTIEGDPESGMTVTDGTVEANVLCGNIQTSNATVYVIDKVLTGIAAG